MPVDQREKEGWFSVQLGLVANILLAGLKTSIGIIGRSPALLADGVNSTSDVAYYLVVSVFMRLAGKPADDEHPYGHRQLESIGALVVGSFVITTAIAIFWNAVNNVYEMLSGTSDVVGASLWTLWVAAVTVLIKIGLTIYTRRIADRTQNAAVMALAYDHRNDVFSALAAVIGITLARMGYLWVDPLAGALVSLVVLRTGVEILRESTADLMDTVPGQTLNQEIIRLVQTVPEIEQIDEIGAHRFGPYLTVNLTVCIDGNLSVVEGDRIATRVEKILLEKIDFMSRVHVHYHPRQMHDLA
jgi:cation diffusion facilitator family transporter